MADFLGRRLNFPEPKRYDLVVYTEATAAIVVVRRPVSPWFLVNCIAEDSKWPRWHPRR